MCCSPWGRKESGPTEGLNWIELIFKKYINIKEYVTFWDWLFFTWHNSHLGFIEYVVACIIPFYCSVVFPWYKCARLFNHCFPERLYHLKLQPTTYEWSSFSVFSVVFSCVIQRYHIYMYICVYICVCVCVCIYIYSTVLDTTERF